MTILFLISFYVVCARRRTPDATCHEACGPLDARCSRSLRTWEHLPNEVQISQHLLTSSDCLTLYVDVYGFPASFFLVVAHKTRKVLGGKDTGVQLR